MIHPLSVRGARQRAAALALATAAGASLAAFYGRAGASPQTAAAATRTEKIAMRFQDQLPRWMAENHVPAVGIAVIQDGRLSETAVFGELRKGAPAPANTLFEVASLTKPIAAMTALKLVNEGRWDLDEPLARYWTDPDVKEDPRHEKLTTRIVLSHQTGFPNWRTDVASRKLAFEFEPGTKYRYSGEGFEYLRQAMERKFGKPLEKIAGPVLLTPLGTKDTKFYWDETVDESRFASPHDKDGKPIQLRKSKSALASDRLITTIEEYGRFGTHVLNGAGLSKKLFDEMVRPQVSIPREKGHPSAFGLGWELLRDLSGGEYALVHTGSDPGIRTLILLLPKSKRGFVILTNGDNGMAVCTRIIAESLDIGNELLSRG
jgi:CubicO group peptidase (beta-lactamase class C family)